MRRFYGTDWGRVGRGAGCRAFGISGKGGEGLVGDTEGTGGRDRIKRASGTVEGQALNMLAFKQLSRTLSTASKPLRVKKQALELTENAALRLANLLQSKNKPYLKIGVRTRGCNGMTYTMNYADEGDKGKFDELVTQEITNQADGTKQTVKVIIDPAALMHVIGTKMDFVSDKLRSEFIFDNPNAKGECGCGESFNV